MDVGAWIFIIFFVLFLVISKLHSGCILEVEIYIARSPKRATDEGAGKLRILESSPMTLNQNILTGVKSPSAWM